MLDLVISDNVACLKKNFLLDYMTIHFHCKIQSQVSQEKSSNICNLNTVTGMLKQYIWLQLNNFSKCFLQIQVPFSFQLIKKNSLDKTLHIF